MHATLQRTIGWALLVTPLLSGCVQEEIRTGSGGNLFRFDDLDTVFFDTGSYHNVRLLFELDPLEDMPGGEYRNVVVPRFEGHREVYSVFDIHEVVYANRQFEVGGLRYDAPKRKARGQSPEPRFGSSAMLRAFKKRRGDLTFMFRRQRIVCRVGGWWIPSIFYRRDRGLDGEGEWIGETVQIGRTKIELDSRDGFWIVDGLPFSPDPDKPLIIEGVLYRDRS